MKLLSIAVAALALSASGGVASAASGDAAPSAVAVPSCAPMGNVTPICGVKRPEDLELTPNRQYLIASQSDVEGHDGAGVGIALVDLKNLKSVMLTPAVALATGWGDADCAAPARLMPHGIHLSRRSSDKKWQLLVVNHAVRESVEFYELVPAGRAYRLVWHGCALTHGPALNDVAATRDGFVASVPMTDPAQDFPRMQKGQETGYIVQWSPAAGLVRLPGTEASFNNGVQASADGRYLIYAAWTGRELRKYDRAAGKVVAVTPLDFMPDNLSLRADGKLLATGISDLETVSRCHKDKVAFCPIGFGVAEVDPADLQAKSLYAGAPGLVPGATVAVQAGRDLYIGALSGERLVKIALDHR